MDTASGIILFMRSANERWRYIVTSSLIGRAHTQNNPSAWKMNGWISILLYTELTHLNQNKAWTMTLTHWSRKKMVASLHTTFSISLS